MNRIVPVLPVLFALFTAPVSGANNSNAMADRLCNLQAREIALRISEELDSDYTAAQRDAISVIAEEVCQDYSAQSSAVPVINRPAAAQAGSPMPMSTRERGQAVAAQGVSSSENQAMAIDDGSNNSNSTEEEESESILGGLKIIAPQDRVRRPGLKRR